MDGVLRLAKTPIGGVLTFIILLALVVGPVEVLMQKSSFIRNSPSANSIAGAALHQLGRMLTITLAAWIFAKIQGLKGLSAVGWSGRWTDILVGLIIGISMQLLAHAVFSVIGWINFSGIEFTSAQQRQFWVGITKSVGAGFNEEMVTRGAIWLVLRETIGWWPSIIVTSLIFTIMHSMSSYGPLLPYVFGIYLVAGFLFALAREVTQSLYLPIGLHIGWNFAVMSILGNLLPFSYTGRSSQEIDIWVAGMNVALALAAVFLYSRWISPPLMQLQ